MTDLVLWLFALLCQVVLMLSFAKDEGTCPLSIFVKQARKMLSLLLINSLSLFSAVLGGLSFCSDEAAEMLH